MTRFAKKAIKQKARISLAYKDFKEGSGFLIPNQVAGAGLNIIVRTLLGSKGGKVMFIEAYSFIMIFNREFLIDFIETCPWILSTRLQTFSSIQMQQIDRC